MNFLNFCKMMRAGNIGAAAQAATNDRNHAMGINKMNLPVAFFIDRA
jgi:hypothetical protein